MPGSAAMLSITVPVSTATTPTGMPPRRARPVTTVRAQPACASVQDPRSNRPLCQAASAGEWPGGPGSSAPAMARRGSSLAPGVGGGGRGGCVWERCA